MAGRCRSTPTSPSISPRRSRRLKLRYVVITSVDRDDLRDGGAQHFVDCIRAVREHSPATQIEVLVPGLPRTARPRAGDPPRRAAGRDESQPRDRCRACTSRCAPAPTTRTRWRCCATSRRCSRTCRPSPGLMVGLGETDDEILAVMRDMRAHHIDMLTIGQYLQPSQGHLPVLRYVHPDTFADVRARSERDGLPPRRGRRAGALVVSRRQAGGGDVLAR